MNQAVNPPPRTPFPLDIAAIVRGEVSDATIRTVLRFGLASELRQLAQGGIAVQLEHKRQFIKDLATGPIMLATNAANEQHYEVPSSFFHTVLGKHLKYSCGYWVTAASLDEAERAMLELVCKRAEIEDGQDILDLGCGWGSLSLYLAEHFPNSRIVGLSNSHSQKVFIDAQARARGLSNVQIETADVAHWLTTRQFDRVLSIEMFEHVNNYRALLQKIAGIMRQDARLFVHIFSHRQYAYPIHNNWMADNFFTGGIMPATDTLLYFQEDLTVMDQWGIDGTHYQQTATAWLERFDAQKAQVTSILTSVYGETNAVYALANWRLFFLAVIEIFGYAGGQEWIVSHHLFRKK